jgi:hypothetical protein
MRRGRWNRPDSRGLASGIGGIVLCALLGVACASTPDGEPSYDFFAAVGPENAIWRPKIEDWQKRMHEEADVRIQSARRAFYEGRSSRLDRELGVFVTEERRDLARRIAALARKQGRRFYRNDEDETFGGDHWPTYGELVERNGDDCDGVDLIAYNLLVEFGFPRDQVFRAILTNDGDGENHMVTLWFEDREDPWVFDSTGVVNLSWVRFSKIDGWTPSVVFNERDQFTVVSRDRRSRVRASR